MGFVVVTVIALAFGFHEVGKFDANHLDGLVLDKKVELRVGETYKFNVQGVNDNRFFDIKYPMITGDGQEGYRFIEPSKVKFDVEGTFKFRVEFAGLSEDVVVSVGSYKSVETKSMYVSTVDGKRISSDLLYVDSRGQRINVRKIGDYYSVPIGDGVLYLTKEREDKRYITPIVRMDKYEMEPDSGHVRIQGDCIDIMATEDELV